MSQPANLTVTVTTTYLELPSRAQFRPALSDDQHLLMMEARASLSEFYRFLYDAVGRDYAWLDRLAWSDDQLAAHLARSAVSLDVLYWRGTPAGYIELDREAAEPGTEIALFGLIPAFHGRGFGKHLLSVGVRRAFDDGAEASGCTPHARWATRARQLPGARLRPVPNRDARADTDPAVTG